jgi:hypothetical protein
MKTYLTVACAALVAAGCTSPITKQDQQSMAAPINCATAPGDLRVLNSEKAHVGKEIANGVSAIFPIGLVVNSIDRQEKARVEVGTGEYNRMLDKKIAEIKSTCGIN